MKRGLKPTVAIAPAHEAQDGPNHRPDEEGIETFSQANSTPLPLAVRITAPMKSILSICQGGKP
jgi:hypothetical protein